MNYGRGYNGAVTIRLALTWSLNTIATEVWTQVGGDTALWYLKQVGIDRTSEGSYPSQSLGGFTKGMTTLEMAAAYHTFATGGTYTEPYAYTEVLDSEGKIVVKPAPISYRVYSEETCFLLSDILKAVVNNNTPSDWGPGQIENEDGEKIDTCGKTGTTSDYIDKWFCGYTPYYTAAVWYGYDNRLKQTEIPQCDWDDAILIWVWCMHQIHKNLPGATFEKPDSIIQTSVCSSGYYPTDACRADEENKVYTDYFVSGSYLCPTDDKPCPVHVTPTPTPTPSATPTPAGGGRQNNNNNNNQTPQNPI